MFTKRELALEHDLIVVLHEATTLIHQRNTRHTPAHTTHGDGHKAHRKHTRTNKRRASRMVHDMNRHYATHRCCFAASIDIGISSRYDIIISRTGAGTSGSASLSFTRACAAYHACCCGGMCSVDGIGCVGSTRKKTRILRMPALLRSNSSNGCT